MTPAELVRRAAERLAVRSDRDLLAQYATARDEEAFAQLVRRFGPLVLGTCRRVLGPRPGADDAFQTVFLALARNAGSLRDEVALPAWLHRVSLRVARKALAKRPPETSLPTEPVDPADPFAEVAWKDIRWLLDEELDRLPPAYREPLVLCWLDGLTRDEAAGRLGVSRNTVKRRLEAGRELLRTRLLRRGIAPALAAVAVLEPTGLRATVPPALMAAVCRAATVLAARTWSVGVLTFLVTTAAVGFATFSANKPQSVIPPPRPVVKAEQPPGSLWPKGVVAQFGSSHFRTPDGTHDTALSSDGKLIAVGGFTVRVYEAATWKLTHTFAANRMWGEGAFRPAFSPDGRLLGCVDFRFVWLWDLSTGKLAHRFDGGRDDRWARLCAFTPDGQFAFADKERLYYHDPVTGQEVRSVAVSRVLHLSQDGRFFVRRTTDQDPSKLALGDTRTGKDLHTFEEPIRWAGVSNTGVSFAPDGKTMTLVPLHGKALEVWNLESRTRVAALPVPTDGDTHFRRGPIAGFTADGKTLWLKSPERDILRWETGGHRPLPPLRCGTGPRPEALHALPDGKTLLTPCENGWMRLWDAATGAEKPIPGRYRDAAVMALTPDGSRAVVGDATGRIDLLDETTGHVIRTIREEGLPVTRLVLNADGTTCAVSEYRSVVERLDRNTERQTPGLRRLLLVRVADGRELRVLTDQTTAIGSGTPVAFLDDGRRLLARHDKATVVWDLETGKEHRLWASPDADPTPSPDGKHLAATDGADLVLLELLSGAEVWRTPIGKPEQGRQERLDRRVLGPIAWAADGRTLACGVRTGMVVVLDPVTGRERLRFSVDPEPLPADARQHRAVIASHGGTGVSALALTPDGKRLASSSLQGTHVAVSDTATGEQLAVLPHESQVFSVAFGTDGKSVATFGSRGIGYRWDLAVVLAGQSKK